MVTDVRNIDIESSFPRLTRHKLKTPISCILQDLNSHWLHDVSIIQRLAWGGNKEWVYSLPGHSLTDAGHRSGIEAPDWSNQVSIVQSSAAILGNSVLNGTLWSFGADESCDFSVTVFHHHLFMNNCVLG